MSWDVQEVVVTAGGADRDFERGASGSRALLWLTWVAVKELHLNYRRRDM